MWKDEQRTGLRDQHKRADERSSRRAADFSGEGWRWCRERVPASRSKGSGKSWTTAFADAAIAMPAARQPRDPTLTAAMPDGTGFRKSKRNSPKRFIETGIARVTWSQWPPAMARRAFGRSRRFNSDRHSTSVRQSGGSRSQKRPVVVFALDRAGSLATTEPSITAYADLAFLRRCLLGMVLMAPERG